MAKYFNISSGMRGCYLADNAYIVKVNTRRELKTILENEADFSRSSDMNLNQKDIASVAAAAWREAHKKNPSIYDYVIPYGSGKDRSFGIFVSVSSRHDWAEFTKENDDN